LVLNQIKVFKTGTKQAKTLQTIPCLLT
jgi:hypothetical protein